MRTTALATAAVAFVTGWLVANGWPQWEDDLGMAVSEALREGDRFERTARLVTLLERLDEQNLADALDVYRRELSSLGECELRLFLTAWTRFDGRAAFEETLTWKHTSKLQVGVEAAAQGWAYRDSAAHEIIEATAAARPKLAQRLRQNLVIGWVHSGRSDFDAYLREVGSQSDELLTVAIGAKLRSRGGEALLDWSESFGPSLDPLMRAKLFRKVVHMVGRRDPQRAARFVQSSWGQDHASEGPRVLAEAWLETDPLEAFEWLRTEAPPASRAQAVGLAFGRWLHMDRAGALAWIDDVERTNFHDSAIHTLARRLATRSLDEARDRCESILSEESRVRCNEAVTRAAARPAARNR